VIFVELRHVFYTRHMLRNGEKVSITCSRAQQENKFVPKRGFAGPETCMKHVKYSVQPQLVED
jgi:hypothetical protein